MSASIEATVDELGLAPYLDLRPSALPQGIAQLVGIARAVVSDPCALLHLAEAVADVAPEAFGCESVSPWPAYQRPGA